MLARFQPTFPSRAAFRSPVVTGSGRSSSVVTSGGPSNETSAREQKKVSADSEKEVLGELNEIKNIVFEDYLVEWDVKGKMHEDEEFRKKVLSGAKFWDLSQARFLLNPLSRDEKVSLFERDKKIEFLRQIEEFSKTPALY